MNRFLAIVILLTSFTSGLAHAGLVSTQDYLQAGEVLYYDTTQLREAIASEELRQQLAELGVDPAQLEDRIASLTPGEVRQLNSELENQPAGGILGVLLLLFVLFVITDMLCATDLFPFVNCINK